MIFVTVGTHEQQFDRLVRAVDDMKRFGVVTDEVVIQTGYSEYAPQCCQWSKFYPYEQMLEYVKEARIVITHGGPSSFIMPLQIGKIPLVVPRKKEFGEHVNDHQVAFCNAVAERQGNILVVEKVEELVNWVEHYDETVAAMPAELKSNNAAFCAALENAVNELVRK